MSFRCTGCRARLESVPPIAARRDRRGSCRRRADRRRLRSAGVISAALPHARLLAVLLVARGDAAGGVPDGLRFRRGPVRRRRFLGLRQPARLRDDAGTACSNRHLRVLRHPIALPGRCRLVPRAAAAPSPPPPRPRLPPPVALLPTAARPVLYRA